MKTLVCYVFHQYNNRVQHFIDNAIFEDPDIDFLLVINDLNLKIDLPSYVKVFNRSNIGFDFGGWSDGVLTNDLYKNYTHFIFANSSIIGPYLPTDYKGKWTDVLINGLSDSIKLFGPTINTCRSPDKVHVQSYVFSMKLETLEYLISKDIFSIRVYPKNMYEAVWHKEVPMSLVLLQNGWNIGCMMKEYKDVNFTVYNPDLSYLDDTMCPREIGWERFDEFVFIKGNRFGM